MDKQRYIVAPVAKALTVLDAVAGQDDGVRLAAVAGRTGLPKTTALRYLCTLEAGGYLDYDPTRETWRVGARFRMLGSPQDPARQLRTVALPIMTELRDRFDETVNLGVLRGKSIVYIEIVECQRRLRLQAHVGGLDPAHSTALGRAILAHLPAAERSRILARHLAPRTAHTVRTRDAVDAELRAVLTRGYAVERGENEAGAVCVGAAVRGTDAHPLGAVSLSAPETRMPESRVEEIGRELVRAVQQISSGLG